MTIAGKYVAGTQARSIYVVQEHHMVLPYWAELRSASASASPLNLITLDHHTDGHDAFTTFLRGFSREKFKVEQKVYLDRIDYNIPASVQSAVDLLEYDEHIRAALESDILNAAFAITHQTDYRWQDGQQTDDKLFVVNGYCSQENTVREKAFSDQVIETSYLTKRLNEAQAMARSANIDILCDPYVLDIDLDYFHTKQAIRPLSPDMFYKLLRQAAGITIALEPSCVHDLQVEGERIDSDFLFDELLRHIEIVFGKVKRL